MESKCESSYKYFASSLMFLKGLYLAILLYFIDKAIMSNLVSSESVPPTKIFSVAFFKHQFNNKNLLKNVCSREKAVWKREGWLKI